MITLNTMEEIRLAIIKLERNPRLDGNRRVAYVSRDFLQDIKLFAGPHQNVVTIDLKSNTIQMFGYRVFTVNDVDHPQFRFMKI